MDDHRNPALQQLQRGARAGPRFPDTSWTLLADAARRGEQCAPALNEIAERYYAAVRAFIAAVARTTVDVDDLTQRFFETVVLSGRLIAQADPSRGTFRAYLKQAIRNFLVDEHRRQARMPSADVRPDGLDDGWDSVVVDATPGPDDVMLRAWAQSLVGMAVARLEKRCEADGQQQNFQLFIRRYLADGDAPSWHEVGAAFGLGEKIARSRADTAARHFRMLLRELIASDVGASENVDEELQKVIAIL